MIVAGFGFRKGATIASLNDALAQASIGQSPSRFATLTDKVDDLHPFAQMHRIPVTGVDTHIAQAQTTLTLSAASQTHRSTGSVAEATALAAAGPNARLAAPRAISADRMATCAIAIGDPE